MDSSIACAVKALVGFGATLLLSDKFSQKPQLLSFLITHPFTCSQVELALRILGCHFNLIFQTLIQPLQGAQNCYFSNRAWLKCSLVLKPMDVITLSFFRLPSNISSVFTAGSSVRRGELALLDTTFVPLQ